MAHDSSSRYQAPLRRVDLWVISDDLRGLLCVSVDNSSSAAVEWRQDRKTEKIQNCGWFVDVCLGLYK